MISGPLYLTSLPLYLCHHTHPINDITATICITSHPVYLWHPIHNIYDIISTKYDITILCVDDATLGIRMTCFALQMTPHPLYCTKSHYLWCHIHFRQDNTGPVSDITPTVSMSSHCFHWHIAHLIWHHTHLLCDIIWTLFNIKPNPYVITLLYLWHHSLYIWNHIQYEDKIYTQHVTSQPLSVSSNILYRQHHTHSFYNITLAICVATFALYKISQPHFLTSSNLFEDITRTLLDIVSTVSVSSQPLHWYHTHFCMKAHPLYMWHNMQYI